MIKTHKHKNYFNQGIRLLENKKYTEAQNSFQKAIDIKPKFIPAWVYKGICLEELQQYEEAIKCYIQAIQINPNVTDLWYNKGTTYCKMKRYGDALTCFDKVLEIEPDNALAKTTRALVIAIMPQMDEAILEKPDGGDSLDFYKIRKILDDVFDYGLGW